MPLADLGLQYLVCLYNMMQQAWECLQVYFVPQAFQLKEIFSLLNNFVLQVSLLHAYYSR